MFPPCADPLRTGKRDVPGCLAQRLAFTWRQVTPLPGPQIPQCQGTEPDADHAQRWVAEQATMRRNWRFRPSRSVTLSQLVDTILTAAGRDLAPGAACSALRGFTVARTPSPTSGGSSRHSTTRAGSVRPSSSMTPCCNRRILRGLG